MRTIFISTKLCASVYTYLSQGAVLKRLVSNSSEQIFPFGTLSVVGIDKLSLLVCRYLFCGREMNTICLLTYKLFIPFIIVYRKGFISRIYGSLYQLTYLRKCVFFAFLERISSANVSDQNFIFTEIFIESSTAHPNVLSLYF